jgi:hypothetical protein
MAAFKRAFAKVQSIDVGLSGQAEHAAYVIGGLPVRNGPNYPCALSTNNWPDHSFVYYLINMEQAQVALGNSSSSGQNLSPSYPPTNDQDIVTFRNLARATGSGIGNIAAHEIGHQLNLPIMDCKISTTGSPDCDNNDTQVYEYYDCKGDPLQVIGGNPVGGGQSLYIVDSPLKWGKTDASSLDSKLSK